MRTFPALPNCAPPILDPSATRLRLRGDVSFEPRADEGAPYYLVEDRLLSRFFRLGPAEYEIVSRWDGVLTLRESVSRLSDFMPDHSLTEPQALALARFLVEMNLAAPVDDAREAPIPVSTRQLASRQAREKWNPLAFRWVFGSGDRVLRGFEPWLSWSQTPLALLAWAVFLALGVYAFLSDPARLATSSRTVFGVGNWAPLIACGLALKALHEISHAVLCRRYGGEVREMGLMFVLLTPLPYIDVTSSWRLRRTQRIHVAAAGMITELWIAAAAACIWRLAPDGALRHVCFNLVSLASLATLVFNANPLMRFDGYYILSDALRTPNLQPRGRRVLIDAAKRFLLGVGGSARERQEHWWVGAFGLASLAWRLFVIASASLFIAALFRGAGLAFVAMALGLWLAGPVRRFATYFWAGKPGERPRRVRFLLTTGALAAVAALCWFQLPWPGAQTAPAIVEFAPGASVRAASPGFVRKIHVADGEPVTSGQKLLTLENLDLGRELAELDLLIRQSEIRGQVFATKGELAKRQAEELARQGLLKRWSEKQLEVDRLILVAPHDGVVTRRGLAWTIGAYLEEGEEALAVVVPDRKELRVTLSQDDVETFSNLGAATIRIDAPDWPLFEGTIDRVLPRASRESKRPALSVTRGGPLPVRRAKQTVGRPAVNEEDLLTPSFEAVVSLSAEDGSRLLCGQRVTIGFRPCRESVGQWCCRGLTRWVRERLAETAIDIE